MKKHNATTHDTNKADNIRYSKSCKNCPYIKVDCVNTEEEIYRWECLNGVYVDLHSWEKPYPHDFRYNGDCGIIIAQSEEGREMKTRKEQLAEMAKHLCSSFNSEYCHHDCPEFCDCRVLVHCEELQYAGYRKQSDTVREFVERIGEVALQMRYEASRVYQERNSRKQFAFGEKNAIINLMAQIYELAKEYGAEMEK